MSRCRRRAGDEREQRERDARHAVASERARDTATIAPLARTTSSTHFEWDDTPGRRRTPSSTTPAAARMPARAATSHAQAADREERDDGGEARRLADRAIELEEIRRRVRHHGPEAQGDRGENEIGALERCPGQRPCRKTHGGGEEEEHGRDREPAGPTAGLRDERVREAGVPPSVKPQADTDSRHRERLGERRADHHEHRRHRQGSGRQGRRSQRCCETEREERQRRDQEPRAGHPAAERQEVRAVVDEERGDEAERQDRLTAGGSAQEHHEAADPAAAIGVRTRRPLSEARSSAVARRPGNVMPKSPSSFAPTTS